MLSLLLITALAVQNPPASKPATAAPATPRGTSQSAVSRAAFHDRMRELWSDHIVYTRSFIVSAAAGTADTSEVLQRLLRNQDEIGEAIKPYYGDAAGSQLASLLRNHIQLAGKAFMAAKGSTTAMAGMSMQDSTNQSSQYMSNRASDTVKANAQYPTTSGRMADTAKAGRATATATATDSTKVKANAQYPAPSARNRTQADSARTNVRTDSAQSNVAQSSVNAQGQMQMQGQTTVDSTSLNQAIADLKSNADSIAAFLSTANPRGFQREALRSAIQMHITLLLKEATAQIKKDWSGSVAAFDESQHQAMQMADMLSDGIMKQFPSRFNNKATTVSSR